VLNVRVRGPWLARRDGGQVEPLVPAPIILGRENNTLFRLEPLDPRYLPGWSNPNGLWPLWRAGAAEAKPVGDYLNQHGLKAFLMGGVPDTHDLFKAEELFGFDERTGLAIAPETLTGIDGMLYGIRLLALQRNVCLYAEVVGEAEAAELKRRLAGPLPLGGEGRYVRVAPLDGSCAWPESSSAGRSLWLLISPAPLKEAHHPDTLPHGTVVRGAATAAPISFSGWDVARNGPEKTRFAVPAGAVYFVEGEFNPGQGSFCTGEDAAVGWGIALRGTWK
jgi:CRISPR-associated protein Cmr3